MPAQLYTKLDAGRGEFRLIQLQSLQQDSQIRCELIITTFHSHPSYDALSYVWEDTRPSREIILNGQSLNVTSNLFDALLRLQPPSLSRILWIDQLCINQSDDDERGQQVMLMGKLYSSSQQTLLWLGEEVYKNPSSIPSDQIQVPRTRPCIWAWTKGISPSEIWQPLLNVQHDVQDLPSVEEDLVYLAFLLLAELANGKRISEMSYVSSNENIRTEALRTVWFIMHLKWWNRVWTVQECIIPLEAILMYGPVSAPLQMFIDASRSYTRQTIANEINFPETLPRANATIMRHFNQALGDIDFYRTERLSGHKTDLVSLLRSFRVREATEEHDKIYGFLGLDLNWHGQEQLYPDYKLKSSQVYLDTTFKLIKITRSLKVLINNLDRYGDSRKTAKLTRPKKLPPPPLLSLDPELQALLTRIDGWMDDLQKDPYFIDTEMNHLQLPSWVPNWSLSTNFEVLARYKQAELYSAARATITTASLIDDSILGLTGLEVDTVRWSSQIMAHTGGEDQASLFRNWQVFSGDATAYHTNTVDETNETADGTDITPLQDAFWRTSCGDSVLGASNDSGVSSFHRATAGNYQNFLSWWETQVLTSTLTASEPIPGDPDISSQSVMESNEQSAKAVAAIEPAIRAATTMRRLFITRKGYLGLGPSMTVGGEKVFILHGGKLPFLLRDKTSDVNKQDQKSYYELVGDCYIHGIMDGEALDWNLPEMELRIL